jgi:hypothetical protein
MRPVTVLHLPRSVRAKGAKERELIDDGWVSQKCDERTDDPSAESVRSSGDVKRSCAATSPKLRPIFEGGVPETLAFSFGLSVRVRGHIQ